MYILQGYKGKLGLWKYFVIPIALLLVVLLNNLLVSALEVDINQLMEEQYRSKGKNRFLAEMLLQFAFLLVVLLLWVKFVHKQTITSLTTSRKKISWGRFLVGFALVAITLTIFTIIDYSINPDNYIVQFQLEPFLIMLLIVIILMPLQTSFEEYFFRGYLLQGIGIMAKNRWVPLVLTSVVFGLLHLSNPEVGKLGNIIMVYYIGTGFLLGIMTLMDEGLELALGFHTGNNMIAALLVTADWTVFQTNSILKDVSEPSAGMDIILPLLILYPIYLIILAKIYKWNNWKQKLFGKVKKPVVIESETQQNQIEKML